MPRFAAHTLRRLASAYSVRSRRRKAKLLRSVIGESGDKTALLVGASGAAFAWSNIVERAVVESVPWSVASALSPVIGLGSCSVQCDGRRLPFHDDAFDLVVSNAVIEHVGAEEDQADFIAEAHRAGRGFVITTPNHWFPVESHTHVVGLHWSSVWSARRTEYTRLLSRRAFRRLLPRGTRIIGHGWSPTLVAVHRCSRACSDLAPAN